MSVVGMVAKRCDAVPLMMNYQGFLTDNSNAPVNGTFPMTFKLYADSTTGPALWTESYGSVAVTAGVFNVVLGAVNPLPLATFTGAKLWLQTTVSGNDMLPRRPLVSVGYALHASVADSAVTGGQDVWKVNGPSTYLTGENVGIGTTTPTALLDLKTDTGEAVEKLESGDNSGGQIVMPRIHSSPNFYLETGAGGSDDFSIHHGVSPFSDLAVSPEGFVGIGVSPVYNLQVYAPGDAVANPTVARFESSRSGPTDGTYVEIKDHTGGVSHLSNIGSVDGNIVMQTFGGAVGIGTPVPNSASALDVRGPAEFHTGPGALAEAALSAVSTDPSIEGVSGIGVVGVDGETPYGGSGGAVGVLGYATNSGDVAGQFDGNVHVAGTLIKTAGSFKIDHPLDPANKYLSHSFVESPDMMNIYNGNVTTDGSGSATVQLPDYFEALNQDFRYQLTVIGEFAQAIVATKIQGNRFTIRTDKPNVEVSWQVTGVRHDAYANAHRIPVVEDKASAERGKYLHAELFGGRREDSIGAPKPHRMSATKR